VLDQWLVEQSGDWGSKYVQSVREQDFSKFPAPKYCAPFCDRTVAPFSLRTSEPNEWDVAFRLSDYVLFDYDSVNGTAMTDGSAVEGVESERIPDLKSTFSTEKLARSMGWDYVDGERGPTHFPQDRTGKIGSMDRKPKFTPNAAFWIEKYGQFLVEKGFDDTVFREGIHKKGGKDLAARQEMGKYVEQWAEWVLSHSMDLKVAFLVPDIGQHAILAFTGDGGRDFYGVGNAGKPVIGLHLQRMDGEQHMDSAYGFEYDFGERLTAQRKCEVLQKGCVFRDIAPGKYVMRYYPMNMTEKDIPGLVQIVAF